jgi:hypothetical protein
MAVSVCPIATIQAPGERVWFLLSEPTNYDLWWDATTRSINPEGHAHRGQKIYARTRGLGKWWDVNVMVGAVNDDTHELDLTTKLPLGITVHNHITCAAVNSATTRVSSETSGSRLYGGHGFSKDLPPSNLRKALREN